MKYAYKNGIILDGTKEMTPIKDKVILVDGETIVDIVDDTTHYQDYEVVDLMGNYIMPGLINLHVHLPSSGKPQKKQVDVVKLVKLVTSTKLTRKLAQKLCANYAKTQLLSGVTTIRTMGGILDIDANIRDDILQNKLVGPRILASNMALSVPGGHMANSLAYSAKSEEEARMYVKKIIETKPDAIKLMITGGVLDAKVKGEPGELKMPASYVKVACDEAHKHGLKVAAHVESSEGVQVALENGVDTIEHGAMPNDKIIQLFKEHQAAHVATFSPALPFALFDRDIAHTTEIEQYNGKIVFDGIIACAKSCLENDILVGIGTDTGCPYVTHYDMWRELQYFHKYGEVSTSFALHTATLQNAKIAGIDHITGSIEKGKCADFVVTKKNPLEDLSALRHIEMVVSRGQIIKQPRVKKMSQVEKELDKFI